MRRGLREAHQDDLAEIHRETSKKLDSDEFKKIWKESYEAQHDRLYTQSQRNHFLDDLLILDLILDRFSTLIDELINDFDFWADRAWGEPYDYSTTPDDKDEVLRYLAGIVSKYRIIEYYYFDEKEINKIYYGPIEDLAFRTGVISENKTLEERLKSAEFYRGMSIDQQRKFRIKHDREWTIKNFANIFD